MVVDFPVISKVSAGNPRISVLDVDRKDTSRLNVQISQLEVDLTEEEVNLEAVEDLQLVVEAMERTTMARGEGPLES